MRQKFSFLLLVLLILISQPLFSTEYYEKLPDFKRIEISGRISVYIDRLNNNDMTVNVKSGSYKDLDFYVTGDTLVLKKKGGVFQTRNIIINLSTANLISSLSVSSGALVKSYRNIFTSGADVRAETNSYLELFINNENLSVNCGRSASVIMKGTLGKLEARASHGGEIDAELLAVLRAHVYSYTGSTIKINSLEYIEAAAGLESKIYYKATPAIKYFSETAGGEYLELL